jgi:hypothetical protein
VTEPTRRPAQEPGGHYVAYEAAQPGTSRAWRCKHCSGVWPRWADISGPCAVLAPDDDDAYPVGPALMWVIYQPCETCGAEAMRPCVGMVFGPHEGRKRRWDRGAA